VQIRGFRGDLAGQNFVTYSSPLTNAKSTTSATPFSSVLVGPDGQPSSIAVAGEATESAGVQAWRFRVQNREPDWTAAEVTLSLTQPVRIDPQWRGERILWPGLYRGALVDDLASAEGFKRQAQAASRSPSGLLAGDYSGRLCLPFVVQEGSSEVFALLVHDPTHQVVRLVAKRTDAGMLYSVVFYPRIVPGGAWSVGEVKIVRARSRDWHFVADIHRNWLVDQGFRPETSKCHVGVLTYGRWDDFRPDEIIQWAKRTGIHDVLLWVLL
jgi:hypothetical protein